MTVAELNAELERILNRLKKDPSVRKVLLFGSLTRGDARDHSDIDLIVVKDMRLEPKRDQDLDDTKYSFQGKRFDQEPLSSWLGSNPGVFLHLSVSSFNILRRTGL